MKSRLIYFFAVSLLFGFAFSACTQKSGEYPTATLIEQPTVMTTQPVMTTMVDETPQQLSPVPTSVTQLPELLPAEPACYIDQLPQSFEFSAAIEGWKLFADPRNIVTHYIYFPSNCPLDNMEQDVNNLFFGTLIPPEHIAIVLLDPIYEGTLGKLYFHLNNYAFWGMGPEDYPMVIDRNRDINPNIIIYRVDRINGEGGEGNAILSMMQSTAEHEYIHTVQGSNNPDLAQLMWSDIIYRAFIERYANLYNNSGQRYYQAAPTLMALLQFLDGMNTRGLLEEKTSEILNEQAFTLEAFLSQDVRIYNENLKAQASTLGGAAYLDTLSSGRVSPIFLVSRAGCGDIKSYDLVRRLYDANILGYNQWYYGSNTTQYLPATFDELFKPAT